MTEIKKPRAKNSAAETEMDRLSSEFDSFEQEIKSLTLDRMNEAPKKEVEQQTKLSQEEIEKSKQIYLKPTRSISSKEKFNEKFRDEYNFSKEYVQFIAENKEIIGEAIEIWTKPFPGLPAEFWKVPTNKPLWGPRYLAEQIKRASYHKMSMQDKVINSSDGMGQYYGSMVVDSTVQRLDAIPVSNKKSVFMGASY